MANYTFASVTTAVAGISTSIYTIGSSVFGVTITTTNGTRSFGLSGMKLTSAVSSSEPNRPVVGQLYPRFNK